MLRSTKITQPTQIPQTPEALDLAPQFLEVVACPSCHSTFALDYDSGELVCSSPSCGLAFEVHDGVPDLRIDAARRPETGEDDEPTRISSIRAE